ncbi:hypothetical protein D8W73_03785 [Citrobacter amalonaticus]|nr:hypothetical protein [Citrobacter amalonaticus]
MRNYLLAFILITSFSATAYDITAAQEAVAHAQRSLEAAKGDVALAQANYGKGTVASWADASSRAGVFQAQAYSDLKAAEDNLANQMKAYSDAMAKANIVGSVGTSKNTINVAAGSLKPTVQVQTPQGIVAAGKLPKQAQVAVAFISAFGPQAKGGNSRSSGMNHPEHGTGNGGNNAANSNSAHGLGGGDHIGGGRAGGGFHY